MARTRTLQELIADVRWHGDTEGLAARHTDEKIVRALNQSQQALRLLVSGHGSTYYLTSAAGVMTADDDRLYPLPADLVAIYGVDVIVSADDVRELFPYQFAERNKYKFATGQTGVPVSWRPEGADLVRVLPAPDAAYSYLVWYLPRAADMAATFDAAGALAASTATFDGIAGWEDWLVLDTCLRLSARDANTNDNYELLQSEFARVEKRVVTNARKRIRNGPGRRLDTRGRRLCLETVSRWRLP